MNPRAAEELIALVMLEDFVSRRRAIDTWSRRWIATMQLEHPAPKGMLTLLGKRYPEKAEQATRAALAYKMVEGLIENEVPALRWEVSETEEVRTTRVEMHVVLQEPRVLT